MTMCSCFGQPLEKLGILNEICTVSQQTPKDAHLLWTFKVINTYGIISQQQLSPSENTQILL